MPFFYAQNLTEQQMFTGNPWEFVTTENITEQIREDKQTRQDWYRNIATRHCFYTGFEGSNPNQRVSKTDNPPRKILLWSADYDIRIPKDRVLEVVRDMKIKPSYIETSLGKNPRLIFILPFPLMVDDYDFAVYVQQQAMKFLRLELLPGLDEGAWTSPERLLCNGGVWEATGHGPIPENALQAFFVECCRGFRFNSTSTTDVPLSIAEKGCREKYPNMDWPGDFSEGAQGPTFWIPASTSPMSAIIKKDGILTFSASADKLFYTWGDILGPDFVKDYATNAIALATKDKWWDENNFWRKKHGIYCPCKKDEMVTHFKVDCGIPAEATKGKKNMMEECFAHLYNEQNVSNAAPYLFRPPGLIIYQGKRRLNTYVNLVVKPASELTAWGQHGKFPLHSLILDGLFDPPSQLAIWLAWHKHFYQCGLNQDPQPGCMCFLMGGVGVGKTLTNREIVGGSVGGFADASGFIVHNESFNMHLFEVPLWCLDDDTTNSDYAASQARTQAILKKLVANKDFMCNQKFRNAGMTEWSGRIVATTNLDFASTRLVGTGENGSSDKISMFKCARLAKLQYPERNELIKILNAERPYFLRWLLEYNPPDYVIRSTRFGYASYQEPSLLEQAHQTSRHTPFKELLMEALLKHFEDNPTATEWRGTVTQLQRMLAFNPQNEIVLRSLKLDQINRYLEHVERGGDIKCRVETGPLKTRVWVFEKFSITPPPEPVILEPSTNQINIFSK